MRIKFMKGDPRAGMVAEVEGNRAMQLIESGNAQEVNGNVDTQDATPSNEQQAIVKAAKAAVTKKPAKKAK